MNYTVNIRPLGPHSGNCRPLPPGGNCSRLAHYAVTATSEPQGSTTGSNVCADHLFPAISYFLGLPSRHA
jgi:hypothetical protein